MLAERDSEPRGINNKCLELGCGDRPIVGLARPELNGWCEEHLRERFPAEWAKLFARESGIKGKTEPRLYTPPLRLLTRETSLGYVCIDFAAKVLGEPFLPWQEWAVIHSLEKNLDSTLRFLVVLILVARQNGKTDLAKKVSLFKLFVMGVKLILGTAQSLDQAEDTWEACIATIKGNPWLAEEYVRDNRAAGRKFFELSTGGKYQVKANNAGAGRGPSASHVNADELRLWLNWKGWSALSKTINAVPNAQIWALSNAGDDKAVVLNHLRARAGIIDGPDGIAVMDEPEDPSIFIAEWSGREGCDLGDMDQLAQANPGLGYTVREIALRSAITTDPPGVYRAEVLCQRVEMIDGAIDMQAWKVCVDESSEAASIDGRVVLCFDAALDGAHVTAVAAMTRSDGRIHVQVAGAWNTLDDMVNDLPDVDAEYMPEVVVWFSGSPIAAVKTDLKKLEKKKRQIVEIKGAEIVETCQEFANLVAARKIVHEGDPLLLAHLGGAKRLLSGDGWRFTRQRSGGYRQAQEADHAHVDGAYAVSGAIHELRKLPPPKKPWKKLVITDED